MAEHSLMMPDDSNNYGIDTHQLDHNFVVDDSDPMDHEKTQLQRDDDYHTMSMSASQDMLASEYMGTPAINSGHQAVFSAHHVSSDSAKIQASEDFSSEIYAREEKERQEKEYLEHKRQAEEERKLAQSDSHTFWINHNHSVNGKKYNVFSTISWNAVEKLLNSYIDNACAKIYHIINKIYKQAGCEVCLKFQKNK